uniref:F-box domain-containing protein n=1 Tax=Ciona savignyi TaxID=51511 RepID=H2YNS1_CIOSA
MDEDAQKVTLQGSMGLHQNNFQQNRSNERTIVEAFKFFRDHYVMKIRDGIASSPAKNGLTEDTVMICTANQESSSTQLDDLPYYCKLVVLSKLAALDICHLSMTSQHWRVVCSDQILWRELLFRDMVKWPNIGQRSIPLMPLSEYLQSVDVAHFVGPDLPAPAIDLHGRLCNRHGVNFKALYFHSAYQRAQDHAFIGVKHPRFQVEEEEASIPTESPMPPLAASQTFPRFLRSLWMRLRSGNGEVIMLGPGMESKNTSKIFRRLLWARPDLLMTVQLLP